MRLKNISRFKIVLFLSLIILFIFSLINSTFNSYSKYTGQEESIYGYVKNIKVKNSKIELRVIGLEEVIVNYYVNKKTELDEFLDKVNLGDLILVSGKLNEPNINTNFNMFNYKEYLKRNNIYYIMNGETLEIKGKTSNILYKIKQKIIDRINNFKYSKGYLHSFVLGDTNYMLDETLEDYRQIGISHLFAISGMHIGLIILLLSKLLSKINKYIRFILITIFLILYLFLIDFSITAVRACLFSLILCVNKNFKLRLSSIEVVVLVFLLISVFNPNYIFNMGFQISIIVSFFLSLFSNKINSNNSKLLKLLKVSYISFISTLPIIVYYFSTINILSIFVNIIFVPLVSYILFPLCILTLIFPIFDYVLFILFNNFNLLVSFFSNISILEFSFAKPHVVICIIYYLILILTYKFPKVIIIYIVMLIIHYNIIYFNTCAYIYIFDVGQGDSILIMLPHNKGNILIDTGGKTSYCKSELGCSAYDLGEKLIIPSLKKLGIKRLDYLILSHGDMDHILYSKTILDNFNVSNIIMNNGNMSEYESEIFEKYNDKVGFLSTGSIEISEYVFYLLNDYKATNENDNSLVVYSNIFNTSFLSLGDSSSKVEEYIAEKYDISNIDILKVSHHGSKTSSSGKFINNINPKYSIISVGEKNRYGHPNEETLDNLKNTKIYRTDKMGSIMFKIYKDKLVVSNCVT